MRLNVFSFNINWSYSPLTQTTLTPCFLLFVFAAIVCLGEHNHWDCLLCSPFPTGIKSDSIQFNSITWHPKCFWADVNSITPWACRSQFTVLLGLLCLVVVLAVVTCSCHLYKCVYIFCRPLLKAILFITIARAHCWYVHGLCLYTKWQIISWLKRLTAVHCYVNAQYQSSSCVHCSMSLYNIKMKFIGFKCNNRVSEFFSFI